MGGGGKSKVFVEREGQIPQSTEARKPDPGLRI